MKAHRRNRLLALGALLLGVGGALGLALLALRGNINYFHTPSEIVTGAAPVGSQIRAGGMVEAGSVSRDTASLAVAFTLSDLQGAAFTVRYEGILPDLFREGQGVVVSGRLDVQGIFHADQVLAKHDENYMPPEVAAALAEAHKEAAQREAGGSAEAGGTGQGSAAPYGGGGADEPRAEPAQLGQAKSASERGGEEGSAEAGSTVQSGAAPYGGGAADEPRAEPAQLGKAQGAAASGTGQGSAAPYQGAASAAPRGGDDS